MLAGDCTGVSVSGSARGGCIAWNRQNENMRALQRNRTIGYIEREIYFKEFAHVTVWGGGDKSKICLAGLQTRNSSKN